MLEAVEVDLPVRVAYDQWTQIEEFPQFMEGVETVQELDDSHLNSADRRRAARVGRGDHRADPGPADCLAFA